MEVGWAAEASMVVVENTFNDNTTCKQKDSFKPYFCI